MSQRAKRKENKRRERGQDPGPITRRQQVAAIRQIKGQEIATAVASNIREAVKQEVEQQLKAIKDTMFDMIDRIVDMEGRLPVEDTLQVSEQIIPQGTPLKFYCMKCGYLGDTEEHENCSYLAAALPTLRVKHEGDGDDRPERAEGSEVQQVDEVVPDEGLYREDHNGEDGEEGPQGG